MFASRSCDFWLLSWSKFKQFLLMPSAAASDGILMFSNVALNSHCLALLHLQISSAVRP